MKEKQLEELYIRLEDGRSVAPIYTYKDFILNEEIEEYEYIGLEITKTAQEVYDEWLENKDKPPVDKTAILEGKVDALTLENQGIVEYTVDLDYRLANLELFK